MKAADAASGEAATATSATASSAMSRRDGDESEAEGSPDYGGSSALFSAAIDPTTHHQPHTDSFVPSVWRVTDNYFIDAREPELSNWCRYVNHADNPEWTNVVVRTASPLLLGGGAYLFALRDIAIGEELLCDYGPTYWGGREGEKRQPPKKDGGG